jgi:hypothetical protein
MCDCISIYVKYNMVCDGLGQALFKNIAKPHVFFKKNLLGTLWPRMFKISQKNRPNDGPKHLKSPKAHIKKMVIKSPIIK